MIISRTPFRVSFFGGGTDYPGWYRKHGGAVLAASIDKYCYISARRLPPFFEHRIRLVYSKQEKVQSLEDISHPVIRETARFMGVDRFEMHHDADLPTRSFGDDVRMRWIFQMIFHHDGIGPVEGHTGSFHLLARKADGLCQAFGLQINQCLDNIGLCQNLQIVAVGMDEQ